MPLYEYGCPTCQTTTDVRHGFDETPTLTCDKCGVALVRRFSAAPIVFKGSGFYVNDSKSSSSTAKADTKTETKTETKSETPASGEAKSETKSEPKTETKTESAPAAKQPEAAA